MSGDRLLPGSPVVQFADRSKVFPTSAAAADAETVLDDPKANADERSAARALICAYHACRDIPRDTAQVLVAYVERRQRVNRYGKHQHND